MDTDRLVCGYVAPSLALSSEQFGVKRPSDDGADEFDVFVVRVVFGWHLHESPAAAVGRGVLDSAERGTFMGRELEEVGVGEGGGELGFEVFDAREGLHVEHAFAAELLLEGVGGGVAVCADAAPGGVGVVFC